MFKLKWLAASALSAGMVFGSATAAMAGQPGPYPSPSQTVPTPVPQTLPTCSLIVNGVPQPIPTDTTPNLRNCRGVAQEDFHVTLSDARPAGNVRATGPVWIRNGRDRSISDVLDVFANRFFFSGVNVRHAPLMNVTVDRAACTILVNDNDMTWRFAGGTGFFRRALGAGMYDLDAVFSFPTNGFRCSLPVGLTGVQAAADLNSQTGNGNLPALFGYTIGVNGTGWATTLPQLRAKPSYFSPINTPTDNTYNATPVPAGS